MWQAVTGFKLEGMNARAALFDLYGDHLRTRGGRATVAALVRLLAPLGITAPAVRTAISRMVRQGWLTPVRLPQGPGYAVTVKCERRLDEAAARIYRVGKVTWSGRWHILVIEPIRDRSRRERLRADLTFLGYAQLSEMTWIGPRPSPELDGLDVPAYRFDAAFEGDPRALLAQAWDLDGLATAYRGWLDTAHDLVGSLPEDAPADQICTPHSAVRRTMSPYAPKFAMAFTGIGLALDAGASWTLQRLVGPARAREMLLLGDVVDAARALELGLVTRVVPAGEVLSAARELAVRLAQGPTAAYGATKRALDYAASHTLTETLELEAVLQDECAATADHLGAVKAFLNKERPHFEGR